MEGSGVFRQATWLTLIQLFKRRFLKLQAHWGAVKGGGWLGRTHNRLDAAALFANNTLYQDTYLRKAREHQLLGAMKQMPADGRAPFLSFPF